MIGRLDRYVARVFLSSWLVSAVFFLGLFGIVNFFGKLDDLLENFDERQVPLTALGWFYLYALPSLSMTIAPFVMLIAALFAIARLQKHNEFVAMVLTGRSPRRVAMPIFVLTGVAVLALVYVQERLVPQVALDRLELEAQLFHADELVIDDIELRDSGGRKFTVVNYHSEKETIDTLYVSYFDDEGRNINISGRDASWDDDAGGWRIQDGEAVILDLSSNDAPVTRAAPFVDTDLRPEDMLQEHLSPFDLSYERVLERSERYPLKNSYQLLRHYHFTYPLSVMLLVLLGVPLALRSGPVTRRGKRFGGSAMAVGLCVLFLVGDNVFRELGNKGVLDPALAAWMPVILAGSLVFATIDTGDN